MYSDWFIIRAAFQTATSVTARRSHSMYENRWPWKRFFTSFTPRETDCRLIRLQGSITRFPSYQLFSSSELASYDTREGFLFLEDPLVWSRSPRDFDVSLTRPAVLYPASDLLTRTSVELWSLERAYSLKCLELDRSVSRLRNFSELLWSLTVSILLLRLASFFLAR